MNMLRMVQEMGEIAKSAIEYTRPYSAVDPFRAPEMLVRPLDLVLDYAYRGPHNSDLGDMCRRLHESSLWPRTMDLMERACLLRDDPHYFKMLEEALDPLPPLLQPSASREDEQIAQATMQKNENRAAELRTMERELRLPPFWMLEYAFKGESTHENTWRGLAFSVIISLFVGACDVPPVECSERLCKALHAWTAAHESAWMQPFVDI